MSWLLFILTVFSLVWAAFNVKRYPRLTLSLAAVVPFMSFYYVGRAGDNQIFIFFAICYFIVVNFTFFKSHVKRAVE